MLDLVKQETERIESRFLEEDKMKTLIIILLAIMLGGCETTNNFVVLRDVPTKPSFTVIPYNNYHYQGVFASKVEEALIALGLKTISPPTVKEVTKASGLNVQQNGVEQNEVVQKMTALLSGKSAHAISIEEYMAYEDIEADYIISSDEASKRLKIVMVKTKEIVATFTIDNSNSVNVSVEGIRDYAFKKQIQNALIALGIKVRELPKPPEPQAEPSGAPSKRY
jgi:hypothetical protein